MHILHLEDSKLDAELVHATLESGGLSFRVTRVETKRDFLKALESETYDLILSDFNLPSFDGFSALEIVKQKCPDKPFIFVSGTIGEELAIETLKKGATDYVLKDKLPRLVHSVRRALHEVEEKKEKAKLEVQFRQAQKMEAFGQLTGGIAHDFNNLLTVINGYTQLRLKAMSPSDPGYADLEEVLKSGNRATSLVRQLLAFSRKQVFEPKVIVLNELVLSLDKMLRRLLPSNIEVVALLGERMKPVKIDPGQFEQVIVNFAVNASHAMPGGGKLVIQTKYEEAASGGEAILSVKDTGTGMSDDVKARIFEPFFTTKPEGQGTGLGLATVYGIVSQSGGRIEVESELGKGSTFIIHLPGVNEPITALEQIDQTFNGVQGSETVLVVDDDPSLRGFMSRILSEQGYKVLEASDGEEAVLMAEKHAPQKLHLLLSDMIMPKMGGKEAARRLRALYPDIRIIYTSGYVSGTENLTTLLELGEAFLQKPFTPSELSQKVRGFLDKVL